MVLQEQSWGTPGGTESADRVADVLLLFAQSDRALGVSEIARALGLSKAVVHRILQSLTARSLTWAVPGESTYILGPAATTLSMRAWAQLDLRYLAAPVLRRLRDETRETTTLSVLVGHQRMYLDQYESPQEVKMVVELGPRFPLHSGASSRAILAHLPQEVIEHNIAQLRELRPDLDVGAYLDDLARDPREGVRRLLERARHRSRLDRVAVLRPRRQRAGLDQLLGTGLPLRRGGARGPCPRRRDRRPCHLGHDHRAPAVTP